MTLHTFAARPARLDDDQVQLCHAIRDAIATYLAESELGLSELGQARVLGPLLVAAWNLVKDEPGMDAEHFGMFIGSCGAVIVASLEEEEPKAS